MRNNPAYATWAARGDAHLERRGENRRPWAAAKKATRSFTPEGVREGGRKAMANRRDKGAEVSVSVCCAEKVGQMNESFIKTKMANSDLVMKQTKRSLQQPQNNN